MVHVHQYSVLLPKAEIKSTAWRCSSRLSGALAWHPDTDTGCSNDPEDSTRRFCLWAHKETQITTVSSPSGWIHRRFNCSRKPLCGIAESNDDSNDWCLASDTWQTTDVRQLSKNALHTLEKDKVPQTADGVSGCSNNDEQDPLFLQPPA